jgi:hypothetical protein
MSPDILNVKGQQFELPVLLPASPEAVVQKEGAGVGKDRELLKAMAVNPGAGQAELGQVIGRSRQWVNGKLHELQAKRFVEPGIGNTWHLTKKGKREAEMT